MALMYNTVTGGFGGGGGLAGGNPLQTPGVTPGQPLPGPRSRNQGYSDIFMAPARARFLPNPTGSPFIGGGLGAPLIPPRAASGAYPGYPTAALGGHPGVPHPGVPGPAHAGSSAAPGAAAGSRAAPLSPIISLLRGITPGGFRPGEGPGTTHGWNPFPWVTSFGPRDMGDVGSLLGLAGMLGNPDLSARDYENLARDLAPGGGMAGGRVPGLIGL